MNRQDEPQANFLPDDPLLMEISSLPEKWKHLVATGLQRIVDLQNEQIQAKLNDSSIEPLLVAAENHRRENLNLLVFDNTPDFAQHLLDLHNDTTNDSVTHVRAMVGANEGRHYGAFDVRIHKEEGKNPKITIVCICSLNGHYFEQDIKSYLETLPIQLGAMVVATNMMASFTGCRIFAKSFSSKMEKHYDAILSIHRKLEKEIGIQTVDATDIRLHPDYYKHGQISKVVKEVKGYATVPVSKDGKETLALRAISLRADRLIKGVVREVNISSENRRKLDYQRGEDLIERLPPGIQGAYILAELLNAVAPNRRIGWDLSFPQAKQLTGELWNSQQGLKPLADALNDEEHWLADKNEILIAVGKELIAAAPLLHWPSLQKCALSSLITLIDGIATHYPAHLSTLLQQIPIKFFRNLLPLTSNASTPEIIGDVLKIYQRKFEASSPIEQLDLSQSIPASLRVCVELHNSLYNTDGDPAIQATVQLEKLQELDKLEIRIPLKMMHDVLSNLIDAFGAKKVCGLLPAETLIPTLTQFSAVLGMSQLDESTAIRVIFELEPYIDSVEPMGLFDGIQYYLSSRRSLELHSEREIFSEYLGSRIQVLAGDSGISVDELDNRWAGGVASDRLMFLKILPKDERNLLWQRRSIKERSELWNGLQSSDKLRLLEILSADNVSQLWKEQNEIQGELWTDLNPRKKLRLLSALPEQDRNAFWGVLSAEERKVLGGAAQSIYELLDCIIESYRHTNISEISSTTSMNSEAVYLKAGFRPLIDYLATSKVWGEGWRDYLEQNYARESLDNNSYYSLTTACVRTYFQLKETELFPDSDGTWTLSPLTYPENHNNIRRDNINPTAQIQLEFLNRQTNVRRIEMDDSYSNAHKENIWVQAQLLDIAVGISNDNELLSAAAHEKLAQQLTTMLDDFSEHSRQRKKLTARIEEQMRFFDQKWKNETLPHLARHLETLSAWQERLHTMANSLTQPNDLLATVSESINASIEKLRPHLTQYAIDFDIVWDIKTELDLDIEAHRYTDEKLDQIEAMVGKLPWIPDSDKDKEIGRLNAAIRNKDSRVINATPNIGQQFTDALFMGHIPDDSGGPEKMRFARYQQGLRFVRIYDLPYSHQGEISQKTKEKYDRDDPRPGDELSFTSAAHKQNNPTLPFMKLLRR